LAGLRIGFALMGKNHEQFNLFSARYLGFNRLSERIAIAALDSTEYYDEMCKRMNNDMDMYYTEFNKLSGFKAYKSFSNFILVKIPSAIKESLNKYLTERNMIVKFMNEDGLFSHIRITIGTKEQNSSLVNMIKAYLLDNQVK
jgi:histidinol-phosphate aminotransferase